MAIAERIEQLAAKHNNGFACYKRDAANADREGREAYWSTQTYHHQPALILLEEALLGGLAEALRIYPRGAEYLDTLIPLNPAAEAALEEARWQVTGMRTAAE